MLSVYELKPAFQRSLSPALDALSAARVTADQVTLSAAALSAATGGMLLAGAALGQREVALLVGPAALARMALCALDGMLARRHGGGTRRGAVLNELGDLVSDALMYLPLGVLVGGVAGWAVVLFVVAGLVAETAGILGQAVGTQRSFHGPMGKSDRALWASAGAVAVAVVPDASGWVAAYFLFLSALGLLTAWNRACATWEQGA